jgi:hypothetical protein
MEATNNNDNNSNGKNKSKIRMIEKKKKDFSVSASKHYFVKEKNIIFFLCGPSKSFNRIHQKSKIRHFSWEVPKPIL